MGVSSIDFEDLQKNKLPANVVDELTEKIEPFDQSIVTNNFKSVLLSFARHWKYLKKFCSWIIWSLQRCCVRR